MCWVCCIMWVLFVPVVILGFKTKFKEGFEGAAVNNKSILFYHNDGNMFSLQYHWCNAEPWYNKH